LQTNSSRNTKSGAPRATNTAGREQQRQQGLLLSQYQYDEQGRLKAHSVSQRDKHLFQRRYNYDANGNSPASTTAVKATAAITMIHWIA